jgi:inhibitor of cysteine peptidase
MEPRIALIILVFAAVIIAGCTGQIGQKPTEQESNMQDNAQTMTENVREENMTQSLPQTQNGTHEILNLGDTITIYLKENPTTGYQWNATVTPGLTIENDTYVADPKGPGIVGSGGMHYWLIRGTEAGEQAFNAIYKRPWEPETGDETRFTMDITVVL